MSSQSSIADLDRIAAQDVSQRYKRQLLVDLDVQSGHTVVDVGCGPGTDLGALARAVGSAGRVIGVDHDPVMLAEAARRTSGYPRVALVLGNAHHLPLRDEYADRARTDRMLQHVADPARAVAELARIVRSGGKVALTEPDWDTLAIDDVDVETSRAYTRYVVTHVVRNATMGRQLVRLVLASGLRMEIHRADAVIFRDFAAGERILKIDDVAQRAMREDHLSADAIGPWLRRLRQGPYLSCVTLHSLVATKVVM
jgi:ubiquinone/menaquinone biosynthesis C-methylase UbiE